MPKKIDRRNVDRKLLARTFHSWARGHKTYYRIYLKFDNQTNEMIDDLLQTMPSVHQHAFQSHYFQKGTGWAKKTKSDQRRMALVLARSFLAEYNRGRFEVGKEFPVYERPAPEPEDSVAN